uniref:C2H2-type domain-containing protein n=1 Tax=Timema shepardi TaxID=629360 RepID=A0A7R9FYL3_TIMSH|nr:unnamed protein product [Timema shepardi]
MKIEFGIFSYPEERFLYHEENYKTEKVMEIDHNLPEDHNVQSCLGSSCLLNTTLYLEQIKRARNKLKVYDKREILYKVNKNKAWIDTLPNLSKIKTYMNQQESYRPVNCNICCNEFRSNNHLKRHQLLHTGGYTSKCNYCNYKFLQNSNFRLHLRTFACKPSSNEKPPLVGTSSIFVRAEEDIKCTCTCMKAEWVTSRNMIDLDSILPYLSARTHEVNLIDFGRTKGGAASVLPLCVVVFYMSASPSCLSFLSEKKVKVRVLASQVVFFLFDYGVDSVCFLDYGCKELDCGICFFSGRDVDSVR